MYFSSAIFSFLVKFEIFQNQGKLGSDKEGTEAREQARRKQP